MHDDDGVLGQDGEVDELLAQELGEDAGADVLDVGAALADELLVGGIEHRVEHVADLVDGLLGALALDDAVVDLVDHEGVIGHGDVAHHDLGLLLTHRDLHAVSLLLRLLTEGVEGGLVARLLLLVGVLVRGGHVGQVGLDGHAGDADADAIRCVDTLVHAIPPDRLGFGTEPRPPWAHGRAQGGRGSMRYTGVSARAGGSERNEGACARSAAPSKPYSEIWTQGPEAKATRRCRSSRARRQRPGRRPRRRHRT